MTCLVTSAANSLHVHFVDGGAGGYTSAASSLKNAAKSAAAGTLDGPRPGARPA